MPALSRRWTGRDDLGVFDEEEIQQMLDDEIKSHNILFYRIVAEVGHSFTPLCLPEAGDKLRCNYIQDCGSCVVKLTKKFTENE